MQPWMTKPAGSRDSVVERAGVGRAVGADEAGAIDREAHGQPWIATSWTTWS